jgi:hypothetical protein
MTIELEGILGEGCQQSRLTSMRGAGTPDAIAIPASGVAAPSPDSPFRPIYEHPSAARIGANLQSVVLFL